MKWTDIIYLILVSVLTWLVSSRHCRYISVLPVEVIGDLQRRALPPYQKQPSVWSDRNDTSQDSRWLWIAEQSESLSRTKSAGHSVNGCWHWYHGAHCFLPSSLLSIHHPAECATNLFSLQGELGDIGPPGPPVIIDREGVVISGTHFHFVLELI